MQQDNLAQAKEALMHSIDWRKIIDWEKVAEDLRPHYERAQLQEEMLSYYELVFLSKETNIVPSPKTVHRKALKDIEVFQWCCFENAYAIAKATGCNYVEGYFLSGESKIHHAWNSYRKKYFDRTGENYYAKISSPYIAMLVSTAEEIDSIPTAKEWDRAKHGGDFMPVISRIWYQDREILVPR